MEIFLPCSNDSGSTTTTTNVVIIVVAVFFSFFFSSAASSSSLFQIGGYVCMSVPNVQCKTEFYECTNTNTYHIAYSTTVLLLLYSYLILFFFTSISSLCLILHVIVYRRLNIYTYTSPTLCGNRNSFVCTLCMNYDTAIVFGTSYIFYRQFYNCIG